MGSSFYNEDIAGHRFIEDKMCHKFIQVKISWNVAIDVVIYIDKTLW